MGLFAQATVCALVRKQSLGEARDLVAASLDAVYLPLKQA
jgi:hypothetical protein